jgi:hypothetical protein
VIEVTDFPMPPMASNEESFEKATAPGFSDRVDR